MASIGTRLYRGELGFDFIGNAKRWYIASAVILLICLASMGLRGFNFGIEFEGGNSFQLAGTEQQVEQVEAAVEDLGVEVVTVQVVGGNALLLRTPELDNAAAAEVANVLADTVGIDEADVSESAVSARWGGDITSKALQALIVFLIAVVIFIAIRFQPKMAVAAVVALLHDLVVTAGIYSLVGFEVSPSTVIGLLTILGFSLYDTVVVFDKVDENTRGILGGSRTTYSAAANLAVNQTLMRSINTSLIALLPVAGLLFVGAGLLGAGTLKDLALVLFVGLAAGAYSSIFLATPILCDLKEREPAYAALRKRVEARKASGRGADADVPGPARTTAKRPAKAAPGLKGKPVPRQPAAGKGASTPKPGAKAQGSTAASVPLTKTGTATAEAERDTPAPTEEPSAAAETDHAVAAPQPSARRGNAPRATSSVTETAVDDASAAAGPATEDVSTDETHADDAVVEDPATTPEKPIGASAAQRRSTARGPSAGQRPRPTSKQRGRPAGKRKR